MGLIFRILLCCLALCASASDIKIVAVVNERAFTRNELNARSKLLSVFGGTTDVKSALNSLIEGELILSEVKKKNMFPSDHDVEDMLHRIAENNNISFQTFLFQVSSFGIKKHDLENFTREELTKYKLLQMLDPSSLSSKNELTYFLSLGGNTSVKYAIIESKDKSITSYNKLTEERKKLEATGVCPSNFIEEKIKKIPDFDREILKNLQINFSSAIIEDEKKFKIYFLCNRNFDITDQELSRFSFAVNNRRASLLLQRHIEILKRKAFIRINL